MTFFTKDTLQEVLDLNWVLDNMYILIGLGPCLYRSMQQFTKGFLANLDESASSVKGGLEATDSSTARRACFQTVPAKQSNPKFPEAVPIKSRSSTLNSWFSPAHTISKVNHCIHAIKPLRSSWVHLVFTHKWTLDQQTHRTTHTKPRI